MDNIFQYINGILEYVFFFDIFFGQVSGASMPFIVAWLIVGGVFLTFRFGFINVRMFKHAYKIITGKYKTADDVGEITPFQSLNYCTFCHCRAWKYCRCGHCHSHRWSWGYILDDYGRFLWYDT